MLALFEQELCMNQKSPFLQDSSEHHLKGVMQNVAFFPLNTQTFSS